MLLIPTDDRLIHKTIFEYKKKEMMKQRNIK